MRVRFLTVGLLILGGLFCGPSLAEGASAAPAWPPDVLSVVQQQPVSTIPPLQQQPVSTIPPLPPTATPIRPAPTATPVPRPAPPAAPSGPTPIPPRPPATLLVPSQPPPRAGGFPTEVAVLTLAGSVAALGGGLWMFARSWTR